VTESASRGFASDPALANCLPVGHSANEFAELIVRYLADRDANRAMTAQFGAAIELNYSYEGFSSLVREKVEQILE
jgi:hypothetical protein